MMKKFRFVTMSILSMLAMLLSGCGVLNRGSASTPTDMSAPAPTSLSTPTLAPPTSTPLPPSTEGTIPPAQATSLPCVTLLGPQNGATLGVSGQEQLTWTEYPDASKYIVTITGPDGTENAVVVTTNQYDLMLETLPASGTYLWAVTVFGADAQPVCTSGLFAFNKPQATEAVVTPTATATPTSTQSPSCITLLTPILNAQLPFESLQAFTWTEYPAAYKYIITIMPPYTPPVTFMSQKPTYTRYLGAFTDDGIYQWKVTAQDRYGRALCVSETSAFVLGDVPSAPTPVPGACMTLLTPVDGAQLAAVQAVEFTWTPFPGAAKYFVTIVPPNTPPVSFVSRFTTYTRYIESFPDGGLYLWYVTAAQEDGATLCSSATFSFTKPVTIIPTP